MTRLAAGVAATLLLALGAAAACTDITPPSRADAWEWRATVVDGNGTTRQLAFHWLPSELPVRIWAEDAEGLPGDVDAAIATWERQFLHGEFRGVRVADSARADVIVRLGAPPSQGFLRALRLDRRAPECSGVTIYDLDEVTYLSFALPIRIWIEPKLAASPALDACLALTTAHELGHALGIFVHSPTATDLMFGNPTATTPTARDRNTAERAAHAGRTVVFTDRRP